MSVLIKDKEGKLILEISNLAIPQNPQIDTADFLKDVLRSLRTNNKDIGLATTLLKRFVLQAITRDDGKRKRAAELTVELLGCVGKGEADYFSDFLSNLEKSLEKEGRSFFSKRIRSN